MSIFFPNFQTRQKRGDEMDQKVFSWQTYSPTLSFTGFLIEIHVLSG